MGSSSSKVARGAARQYPSRAPGAAASQAASRPRPKPRQDPLASEIKSDAVKEDAADPDFSPEGFSQRLQQMGIAKPNPTFSPSSIATPQGIDGPYAPPSGPVFPSAKNNTTLSVLEARRRLQQQADSDFEAMGRASSTGRQFVDVRLLTEAMQLRQRGVPNADIEKKYSLQPGLLEKLGKPGTLEYVSLGN